MQIRRRLFAVILDSLALFLPDMVLLLMFGTGVIGLGLFALLAVLYRVVGDVRYGQTVGKWIMHLKVEQAGSSRRLGLSHAIPRELIFGLAVLSTGMPSTSWGLVVQWAIALVAALDAGTLLVRSDRRALHDLLARSRVVADEERAAISGEDGATQPIFDR